MATATASKDTVEDEICPKWRWGIFRLFAADGPLCEDALVMLL